MWRCLAVPLGIAVTLPGLDPRDRNDALMPQTRMTPACLMQAA